MNIRRLKQLFEIATLYRFFRYLVIYPLLLHNLTPAVGFILMAYLYGSGAVRREEVTIIRFDKSN